MRLRDLPTYAAITLPMIVIVLVGGTFNGILNPDVRLFTLLLSGGLAVFWLIVRTARGRESTVWDASPIDPAMPVWIAALALSTLANLSDWRRIGIGLWYAGVYLLVWYFVGDVLVKRPRLRSVLNDALLIVGAFAVYFGWVQFIGALQNGVSLQVIRPVSAFGNPNTLAAFLILLIPFGIGRALTTRGLFRLIMAVYTVAAVGLLAVTFSRAAWLAAVLMGLLTAALWGYNHRGRLRDLARRPAFIAAAAGLILLIVAVFSITVSSLSQGGRTLDLRVFIYETAVVLALEQPITGHGLFTFGGGLARLNSTPPTEPHSHAHNLPLNVAAELGLIGLAALALTVYGIGRAAWRNLNAPAETVTRSERLLRVAACVSAFGFGVNQLLDFPAMMPSIFGIALIVIRLATLPVVPAGTPHGIQRAILRIGLPILLIVVVGTGLYNTLAYRQYVGLLQRAAGMENPAVLAETLMPLIQADPQNMVYHQQQGFLFAAGGDHARAAVSFARAGGIAPEYAINWNNQAVAFAAAGDWAAALTAYEAAYRAAPDSPYIRYGMGIAAEQVGDTTMARRLYEELLNAQPDTALIRSWRQSPLRVEVAASFPLTPYGQAAHLLIEGQAAEAAAFWRDTAVVRLEDRFLAALIAQETGNDALVEREARDLARFPAWSLLIDVRRAQRDGQPAQALLDALNTLNAPPMLFESDDPFLGNINYVQFLSLGLPRVWLPGTPTLPVDPVYTALVEWMNR
ncbi:MAG: O-antigen ligase family protein [bacterium]|nr:O-antigen ligase family protein [bacterium]